MTADDMQLVREYAAHPAKFDQRPICSSCLSDYFLLRVGPGPCSGRECYIVIEPLEVQAQPDGWKKISEERTSQLDRVAPKIIKRVYIRPRYVKQERFALAPLPPQPIEQGMVGPGLLAQILVSKYECHQPLYRQEKMFRHAPNHYGRSAGNLGKSFSSIIWRTPSGSKVG
jgi:transposase